MSEAQSEAAKQVWARRKEREAQAAANAAEAAADAVPDEAVESMSAEIMADPPKDEPQERPKVDHSTRMSALDEIRKARETEEASSVHEEEPPEIPVAEPTPAPETEPVAEEASGPEMVEIKVDGQSFQVPKTDVDAEGGVAAFQINRAAERRLHKAAELARANADALAQTQKSLEPPPPSVDEILRAKVAELQFGTEDEAVTAIKDMFLALKGPELDPQKLKQEAREEWFAEAAMNEFVQRNQDIMSNRMFAQVAALTERDMLASQGKPSNWRQFYADLEGNLRNSLGRPTIAASGGATQTTSLPISGSVADKDARKASIVALPTAAARAAAPEEPKEPTREETLARLKRARGQPV